MKLLNESNFDKALQEMKEICKAKNRPFILGLRPKSALVFIGKLTEEEKEKIIEISRIEKNG